ncbi:hypothetical protein POJ06DRAFT_10831 [Lipomyces tetrasporus]|uniref:Uncharacterized protein n=1 Tax=Lipomyces tetrasporus TaxID=54092 RepID=A0AAD7VWD9_9ASCO|nr:uncharacterized protein POJ06DRAFT_10831 [Lipomyces tetrasporus]KAJ8104006.1 hypothetical protein POJ06DRAFT_10831 [Lipomyces tetrasporus]
MLAMASTTSATATFFSPSSDDISLLASSDRGDSPFAPFNPAIREFAPSRQLASASSPTGVIGSKRPATPAQDSFEVDSFSNPGSPSNEFDERKAIPSALLDSPQAVDRRPESVVNRYSNGSSFGLRSVSGSVQQPQPQQQQDMSISKLERHSSRK